MGLNAVKKLKTSLNYSDLSSAYLLIPLLAPYNKSEPQWVIFKILRGKIMSQQVRSQFV